MTANNDVKLQNHVSQLIGAVSRRFIERDEQIRILVLGIMANENVFLIGEPGVAKTDMIDTLAKTLNLRFWDYHVLPGSKKESFFGDSEDKTGTALDCELAFLDEVYKADSDSLNPFLTVMNEKIYRAGGKTMKVPLISMVAASNELPKDKALEAFHDRWLLRLEVLAVSKQRKKDLFLKTFKKETSSFVCDFDADFLRQVPRLAKQVVIPDNLAEDAVCIIDDCTNRGIYTGDRRIVKLSSIFQVSAFVNDRKQLDYSDLFLLKYILWNEIQQQEKVYESVHKRIFGTLEQSRTLLQKAGEVHKKIETLKSEVDKYIYFEAQVSDKKQMRQMETQAAVIPDIKNHAEILTEIISQFFSSYEFALFVENQIAANVFLPDFKARNFPQDIVDRFVDLEARIESIRADIDLFINLYSECGGYHGAKIKYMEGNHE